MELLIDVLEKVNNFVAQLDEECHLTARQQAIREAARLLIYLTHDEFYNSNDTTSIDYLDIAEKCTAFVLH